jgi:hypothetical protein
MEKEMVQGHEKRVAPAHVRTAGKPVQVRSVEEQWYCPKDFG